MLDLLANHFNLRRLKAQFKNRKLSLLTFYDHDSCISSKCRIQRMVIIRNSKIDGFTFIGYNSTITNARIGKFCSISKNVNIGIFMHPIEFISTSPVFFAVHNGTGYSWTSENKFDGKPAPVTIGNDVWIGMNVTIMGGITIGNGAIIAAHCIVTKNVPAYAIVGGVPARLIRYRFEEEIRQQLEATEWWNLPEAHLQRCIRLFQANVNTLDMEDILKELTNNKLESLTEM